MLFGGNKKEIITDEKLVDEALTRGVSEVLPAREGLKKLLMSGKRIKLYQGFDPTGSELHIGHMVGFRKLAQFQRLGHEVIFLVGDGTGQAGDPSGKLKDRGTFYTQEQLRDNAKEYLKQAGTIVDFEGDNAIELQFNGDWLTKLSLMDILGIAEQFTLQQLLERDMYQKRMKQGEPIGMREFLYPFLQGYDSVEMEVDLEVGGVDQTFNMLAGRTLLKRMKDKEKFVLTTPLLVDASGRKIGKTEGNVIGLTDEPSDQYGKIMSLGDDIITKGLEYLTDVSMEEIHNIEKIIGKENPKPQKERLAFEIVKQLHGDELAKKAQEDFANTFSKKEAPENVAEVVLEEGTSYVDALLKAGVVESRSDFRRLKDAGAIKNIETGKKIQEDVITETTSLKVGKHRFIKIIVE